MKPVTLREYDYLTVGEPNEKVPKGKRLAVGIPQSAFDYLERLLEKEESKSDADDYAFFLSRKGKLLFQVQSYVGVLQTPCGTQIEILPKTANATDMSDDNSRKMLLRMLRYLKDANFKQSGDAHLRKAPMHLLELFISYFLQEVNTLVKRGIRSDYVTREENQGFLKGKLLVKEQVRVNAVQQQRFFCAYDEYEPNRPENRLLHSALLKVLKISRNTNNQRLCRELLFVFADVPYSRHVKQDFSKCKSNRAMMHYQHPLAWCRIILDEESTVPEADKTASISILFPMEKIFEDYVVAMLKKQLQPLGFTVTAQAQQQHLCTDLNIGENKFRLKPDILIRGQDGVCWVADTKWKTIDASQPRKNYLISQGDMYQMYAYGHKYQCQGLFLIYPQTEAFKSEIHFEFKEGEPIGLPLVCLPFGCDSTGSLDHFQLYQQLPIKQNCATLIVA